MMPALKNYSVGKFVVKIFGCKFPYRFDPTAITKLKSESNYVAN